MKIAVIAIAALLTGCTVAKAVYLPDGRSAAQLSCSGWANSWGQCEKTAGDMCGSRGYDVADKHEETVYIGIFHQPKPIRQMTIKCKPPSGS
jgi:hypothetical protein